MTFYETINFKLIKNIVRYAKKTSKANSKKINFGITTNGTLLTNEIIDFFARENFMVLVSYDGFPEVQNLQRPFKDGSESYMVVANNIKKLQAKVNNLRARATICSGGNSFKVKDGLKKIGFPYSYISKASPVVLKKESNYPQKRDQAQKISREMIELNRLIATEIYKEIKERNLPRMGPYKMLSSIISQERLYYSCGVGKSSVAVSNSGEIFPCHRFVGQQDLVMGTIFDGSKFESMNQFYDAFVDNLPKCMNCWIRYYCGGGCLYHNKAYTGNIYEPETSDCEETKSLYKGLMHIYCNLDEENKEYLLSKLTDS